MEKIDNDKMWAFLANYVPSKETESYFKELSDMCQGTTIQDVVRRMVIDGLADQELLCRNSDAKEIKGNDGKFSPKFKPGDWVVWDGLTYHINDVTDNGYCCNEVFIFFSEEENMHLWTIEDAEDGDVLAFKNNIGGIIICKSPTNYDTKSYCRLVSDSFVDKEEIGWDSTLLYPATKEQREILFTKMKDAGYEWDVEKKELRKLANSAQTCKDCKELTEFESSVRHIISTELTNNFGDVSFGISLSTDEAKHIANKLLPIARKQIASEIDVADLVITRSYIQGDYSSTQMNRAYKQGILDVLKVIKGT